MLLDELLSREKASTTTKLSHTKHFCLIANFLCNIISTQQLQLTRKDNIFENMTNSNCLTLIWVSFLGVCFEVWGGWGVLKPVITMLETSNLARKYKPI